MAQLPNLAQQALERLAAANALRHIEHSPDDFRPLKKRRIQEPQPQGTDDDEKEVCGCGIGVVSRADISSRGLALVLGPRV